MLLLHLSKVQDYQVNVPFDQLTFALIRIIEVCIELLLHHDKLTRICINTENTLQTESKAKLISEEISDVFSDRTALEDIAKHWLIKTLRVALTSLHILTPSIEQIISHPTEGSDLILSFREFNRVYRGLIGTFRRYLVHKI